MLGANVTSIYATPGSYLERELIQRAIPFKSLVSKQDFFDELASDSFTFLVSNGCPYKIPLHRFSSECRFINVHPSFLPDLRGADPVPGALLFARDAGATCHQMDEGLDTGPLIAQVKIPYTPDLDAALLYQLCFMAERDVIREAYFRRFQTIGEQSHLSGAIYYTRRDTDLEIDLFQSAEEIVRRVRAFSNRSQGAILDIGGKQLRVYDAEIVSNKFLIDRMASLPDGVIAFAYEDNLLVKKNNAFVKLKRIVGDMSGLVCDFL